MDNDKLTMQTPDLLEENFKKLSALFPSAVTETIGEDGKPRRTVDADVLRQLIDADVAEGREERYQFTWPEKAQSVLRACAPTRKTLRLDRGKSQGRDGTAGNIDTGNIYIEGDNLEALKILQETYLGKVKMIYIDPPYNTGNDFIYRDVFSEDEDEYLEESGQLDDEGGRLVQNMESSGRFHTNWLNMIYPRLWLARDLLAQDGVIFISIDDNEQANLKKACDDIFGERNKVGEIIVIRAEGGGMAKQLIKGHDYLFIYARNINSFSPLGRPKDIRGKIIDKDGEKYWVQEDWLRKEFGKYGNCYYEEILEYKGQKTLDEINLGLKTGKYMLIPKKNGMNIVGKLRKVKEDASKFYSVIKHLSADGVKDLRSLDMETYFSYPKPISLMKELVLGATFFTSDRSDIILDFFSGSATTAHAVMQLNAEDGGHRRFIMVQLPEECAAGSEARKAGYSTICEIGKERIRRAGRKIREEMAGKADGLDVGFRVFYVDSSNMKDVWYTPEETAQDQLGSLMDNIKEDRTAEDLLFQAMLELGIELSADIAEEEIAGHRVFFVRDGALAACFDANIKEETLTEIAKRQPLFAVLRDSGLGDDSAFVNFEQIFKAYSPNTRRRVL